MYDRAERQLTGIVGNTNDHVGPGTYDAEANSPVKLKTDGYAPFLSMSTRDSFLTPNDSTIAAPGPGQYDLIYVQDSVMGGRAIATRSKRFSSPETETPGPGAYTLSKKKDWIRKTGSVPQSEATSTYAAGAAGAGVGGGGGGKGGGMLMSSRIKYQRKPQAPSIPSPGQAHGFEEAEDGTLHKQEAPDRDTTRGPAFYKVQHDLPVPAPTLKYKGNHFSHMTSRRMDFSGAEGPGPGEYNPHEKPQVLLEHAHLNTEDKPGLYEAKIPRYHERIVKDEEKKSVPGPGKYDIPSTFDTPVNAAIEGLDVEHPPFGSQAKRFTSNKEQKPAPGAYNDPRSALEVTKRITGLKRSPFGQTAVRFNQEHHIRKTPGPAQYAISGMGAESMKKAYLESTRRGAFGSTAVRVQPMSKVQESEQPSPAQYQPKEKPFQTKYQQHTANFQSMTNRFNENAAGSKDAPPPGSYDVHKAFKKTQDKIIPGAPRTVAAKRNQGSFKSSSSRFDPPRDIVIEESDPLNPGPGTYIPKFPLDKKGNMIVAKDQRFRFVKQENPGPGTYEFSPLLQDSVLKGTFNATLSNPIIPKQNMRVMASSHQPFLLGV